MHRSQIRRALIAILAAAIVQGLTLMAGPALASLAKGPVSTVARSVVTSVTGEQVVELPIAASHVVLHWAGSPNAQLSVAFATDRGAFGPSEPVALDDGDSGPELANASPASAGSATDTFGDVLPADGARFVRVTSDAPLARLTIEALDTRGSAAQALADAAIAASGAGVADAAVTKPTIISRAAWGANESYRFDSGGYEIWPRAFDTLQKLIVHHTAGRNNDPNPAATMRAIYYDHAVIRGHGDIDYNFLIDSSGRVYEGRYSRPYAPGEAITGEDQAGNPVRGGHAQGHNYATVGISLLGNFTSVQPPAVQRNALISMLAWESERHGLDPMGASTYDNAITGRSDWLANIAGHRDVYATACPGQAFYSTFPTLRSQVAAKIAATTGPSADGNPPTAKLTAMQTPTGGSTTTFGLPFSEPVTGLSVDDFAVSGTSAGWAVTGIAGTASVYTVTVHSDAPTDGSVVLSLGANSVTDLAGHAGPAAPADATAMFATDTTAPTVTIWTEPHGASTNAKVLDVAITFSEPVEILTLPGDITIGGTSNAVTPWAIEQMLGSGATYGFNISSEAPANGTLTIGVPAGVTTDAAGNPNEPAEVTITIDRTAPMVSLPLTMVVAGATFDSRVASRVIWVAADAGGAGLASYDLERSIDGGAWVVIATGLRSPAAGVSLSAGHTYRFAVRARDAAGNVGAWRLGVTTHPVFRQETSSSLHWSSGWAGSTSSLFSGGGARFATSPGAWMSSTFTGRSIGVVTTLGTRGQVRVYLDGAYITTLDLRASPWIYRNVAWSHTWSSAGTHTLKLVVVGTAGRPRVDVDAILILG